MAVVNSDPQVKVKPEVSRSRSTFPLSYSNLDTMRFGEYHPHLCIDGISSDNFPWRCVQDCRSFNLKAPLMQQVKKNLDYILVPLRAILPFQAERIETIPELGDDVPSDAYTSVSNFCSRIKLVSSTFVTLFSDSTKTAVDRWTTFWKWLVFMESIFSHGSLLSSLGCHLSRRCRIEDSSASPYRYYDLDEFFEMAVSDFLGDIGPSDWFVVKIDGLNYNVGASNATFLHSKLNTTGNLSFRQFLEKIRDTSDWLVVSLPAGYSLSDFYDTNTYDLNNCIEIAGDFPLDLARLWAYQLSCAEFFTNDKIDYIYSAELFRQYISYLLEYSTLSDSHLSFSWNGLTLTYDWLCAKYFTELCGAIASNGDISIEDLQYFISLFGYKRSLRYVDYFVGARTRPLAVGDTSIPVVGGQVSVIDVTRRIQTQKLLNFVQSVPRKAKDYLRDLFGVGPGHDYHDPLFLAHTSDGIGTSQIENTSSEQLNQKQTITAIFNDASANFEFSTEVVEPCIILGLTSFDIKRSYLTTIDRSFFTRDRYDMFIPQLQYVGDQAIFKHELDAASVIPFESPFGYTYHDMQYKIIADRAQGGFASGSLPGYAFLADPIQINTLDSISPDFIRSRPTEMDDFFIAFSGYSLGNYYHFIVVTDNLCDASRPMAANPKIL